MDDTNADGGARAPTYEELRARVGELEQTEEVLRRAERRHLTMREAVRSGYLLVDLAGRVLEVNEAYVRMSGYGRDELLRLGIADLDPVYSPAGIQDRIREICERGSVQFETRHRRKDGTVYDVDVRCTYLDLDGGLLVSFVWDISARKAAEQALRDSQADLNRAQAVAQTGSWRLDVERDELRWSDETYRIFGVPRGTSLTYERFLQTVHPEDRERVNRRWTAALAGEPYEIEHRILVDGAIRWVRERAELEVDEHGVLRGGFGTVQDVTERKRGEEHQALLTEVLRVLNRAGDLRPRLAEVLALIRATACWDAVGLRLRVGDDCPYFEQSGFAPEFLAVESFLCARDGAGAVRRDETGAAVLECTCGLVLAGRTDPTMTCFTGGGSFWSNRASDLLALPPAADPRTNPRNRCIHCGYQSVGLFPVRAGDEIVGLLQLDDRREGRFTPELVRFYEGLAQNIGLGIQRAAAEEALREANRRKDEFLGMLSHELRNPLMPIRNSLFVLERAVPGSDQARRAQAIVGRQVEHLAKLVDDLLDVTRIARGKIQLRRQRVELGGLVSRAVEDLRGAFVARRIALALRPAAGPLYVDGDPTRLVQVICNLLQNALKFTAAGGQVVVLVTRDDAAGRAEIRVRDTGAGIAAELLPRVFEPFVQAAQTLDRSNGGLGLGLALVKGVVELHGGEVAAASEGPGRGAELTIRLPLDAAPLAVAGEEPSASGACARRLEVLLIEDNVDGAASLGEAIALLGHRVRVAHDGPSGLAVARQRRPDVVLCDLGLPGMDGYAVARELRTDGGFGRVALVALSGYAQPEDVARARGAGFDEHLAKPPRLDDLRELLTRAAG